MKFSNPLCSVTESAYNKRLSTRDSRMSWVLVKPVPALCDRAVEHYNDFTRGNSFERFKFHVSVLLCSFIARSRYVIGKTEVRSFVVIAAVEHYTMVDFCTSICLPKSIKWNILLILSWTDRISTSRKHFYFCRRLFLQMHDREDRIEARGQIVHTAVRRRASKGACWSEGM